jgi:glutamate dehydrogenase (NAD(P)+)
LELLNHTPQISFNSPTAVFHWKDPLPTGAEGWVVLDKIINQVSGGGIFMHKVASLKEVIDIASNMSFKFTVTNPQIGGAKAGIRFDHKDPRATGVLRRFILAHNSLLQNVWVTAGDLNVDDRFIEELIQQELGLQTYQFALAKRLMRVPNGKDRSSSLSSLLANLKVAFFPLIGACVGYGVAKTIEFIDLEFRKNHPSNDALTVSIQGFGVVASSLAYFLQDLSIAKVVSISDKYGCLYNPNGLDIKSLLIARDAKIQQLKLQHAPLEDVQDISKNIFYSIPDQLRQLNNFFSRPTHMNDEDFLLTCLSLQPAHVFSPCATRYPITSNIATCLVDTFWSHSLRRYLVGGANNMFGIRNLAGNLINDDNNTIFSFLQNSKAIVVPDWVSNSGTAQLFHQILSTDFDLNDPNVAQQILSCIFLPIQNFLSQSLQLAQGNLLDLFTSCYLLSQNKLLHPSLLDFDPSL